MRQECKDCDWKNKSLYDIMVGCEVYLEYATEFGEPPCRRSRVFDEAGGRYVRMADGAPDEEDPVPGRSTSETNRSY